VEEVGGEERRAIRGPHGEAVIDERNARRTPGPLPARDVHAAKEAQGLLEARIKKFEGDLANCRILDAVDIDTSKVSILTKVKITNLGTRKSMTYQIVSEKEADLKLSKISVTSPIGKGLLGKKVGDVAEVIAPTGLIRFMVEEITV